MNNLTNSLWKGSSAALILCCAAVSRADLQLKITVSNTGAASSGMPTSGEYEVDYQGSRARIVNPDGVVSIVDFTTSRIAVLNSTAQTYYVISLQQALGAGKSVQGNAGSFASRNVFVRSTGSTQTLFGVSATKYSILPQPLASNFRSRQGIGNLLDASFLQQSTPPFLVGRPAMTRSAQANSSGSSQTVPASSLSGNAWLTDATTIGQNIPSSAPMALIGSPKSVAYSLTQALDAGHGFPLAFAFSWPGSTTASTNNLTMSVTAAQLTTLATALTQVPASYTEVAAPNIGGS